MPVIRVVFCYSSKSRLTMEAVQAFVHSLNNVVFEAYDEDTFIDLKKSRRIRGHFAARKLPFCGIYVDDRAVKGFYSEVSECTADRVNSYLKDLSYIMTDIKDVALEDLPKMFKMQL